MIFDDRRRNNVGAARENEPAFAYLDQSSRTEAARIRALLNAFADRYPASGRDALIARVRTERSHHEAVFELLMHEWCLRAGMRVLDVEPEIPGTGRRPNFLVEAPAGRFYLECTTARGMSDANAGARARRAEVLNSIDSMSSPDFLLGIDVQGTPERPVAVRALVGRIATWLAQLDFDAVLALTTDDVPRFEENCQGMLLNVRPIPRGRSRGDPDARNIGVLATGIDKAQPWTAIRAALIHKAGHYGTPDLPLVVALDAFDRLARLDHVCDALFGVPAGVFSRDGGFRETREPNGVWWGPRGEQCTRLSAVLVADRLQAWTLGQRDALFVENPWAVRPADFVEFGVQSWRLCGEDMRWSDGRSLQDILGIPAGWPEGSAEAAEAVRESKRGPGPQIHVS